ncbi:hypothetical protein [Paraburkholderia sp. MM5384-R2]|uniref:IclR family transcriptional regulator domain-containing protein n=1 Tax=Paraburkholderia sp. MM5384-R2 TaxID=2723097 RepID=UPI00160E4B65|nr:hypothetical protein [Paraburkholderia sp. MM5384-R2]MBB5500001.1 DNA-binding IclR family transcriptional regulator [Paraburkholderia sp. MM5384-R2]
MARQVLQGLYNDNGEIVQLSVLAADDPSAESINVIETRKPIRLSFPVGLCRPLYCSSIGKLLPAHQPPARSTTPGEDAPRRMHARDRHGFEPVGGSTRFMIIRCPVLCSA